MVAPCRRRGLRLLPRIAVVGKVGTADGAGAVNRGISGGSQLCDGSDERLVSGDDAESRPGEQCDRDVHSRRHDHISVAAATPLHAWGEVKGLRIRWQRELRDGNEKVMSREHALEAGKGRNRETNLGLSIEWRAGRLAPSGPLTRVL